MLGRNLLPGRSVPLVSSSTPNRRFPIPFQLATGGANFAAHPAAKKPQGAPEEALRHTGNGYFVLATLTTGGQLKVNVPFRHAT